MLVAQAGEELGNGEDSGKERVSEDLSDESGSDDEEGSLGAFPGDDEGSSVQAVLDKMFHLDSTLMAEAEAATVEEARLEAEASVSTEVPPEMRLSLVFEAMMWPEMVEYEGELPERLLPVADVLAGKRPRLETSLDSPRVPLSQAGCPFPCFNQDHQRALWLAAHREGVLEQMDRQQWQLQA